MSIRTIWAAIRETFTRYFEDQPFVLAAALAFYTLLSLAPLLLVVVGIASMVYGHRAARGELVDQIEGLVGREGAEAVQTVLAHAEQVGGGPLSLTIGLIILLFGATTVLAQLQAALNHIWGVKVSSQRSTIWAFIRTRLLALGVVLLVGLLLIGSLVIGSVVAGLQEQFDQWIPGFGAVSRMIEFLISLILITLLIALVFKYLPDVRIQWRHVWIGAIVTGILFMIGRFIISLYLGQAGVASAFGAAGSLVVLLLWVYYSALIFFFGAEITLVYTRRTGQPIAPAGYAVPTKQIELEPTPDTGEKPPSAEQPTEPGDEPGDKPRDESGPTQEPDEPDRIDLAEPRDASADQPPSSHQPPPDQEPPASPEQDPGQPPRDPPRS